MCLDTFHIFARYSSIDSIKDIQPDKLFIIQLADAPYIDMQLLEWSRHYRNFPGMGQMPVSDFMKEVVKTGYDGILSLEIFSDNNRNAAPEGMAVHGLRSLRLLQDEMYDLSMPPQCDGIAYVEFAVSKDEYRALAGYFVKLGFCSNGMHKDKKTARFTNGLFPPGCSWIITR